MSKQLVIIQERLATKAPTLTTIPQELRDRVYDCLEIVDKNPSFAFILDGHAGPRVGRGRASIYYGLTGACKQLHKEIVDLYWTKNAFQYIPPRGRKRQMSDKHLHLVERWEVGNEVKVNSAQIQPRLNVNCWRGEIQCRGHVWKVSENKLVLLEVPLHPKYPVHLFPPLAEKAIPILKTLQNATRDKRVMEWDKLQDAYERIGQLPNEPAPPIPTRSMRSMNLRSSNDQGFSKRLKRL